MTASSAAPLLGVCLALSLGGCGSSAELGESETTGAEPTIPEPSTSLIPLVNIAPAEGWPAGAMPQAAAGLAVTAFPAGLDPPRWLYLLPHGDVLVAETGAPERPGRPADRRVGNRGDRTVKTRRSRYPTKPT